MKNLDWKAFISLLCECFGFKSIAVFADDLDSVKYLYLYDLGFQSWHGLYEYDPTTSATENYFE
jgi:hypothetical protein